MIIQFTLNFLLSFILLYLYLSKFNYNFLFDRNPLGLGSKKKTKTGSGIVFAIIILINTIYYFFDQNVAELLPNRFYVFALSIALLSIISYFDDINSIDPRLRLIFQIIIIYFSLTLIDLYHFVLPLKLIIFLYLSFWIYITNITNFIDGSDGYLSVNVISFSIGILIINQFVPDLFFSYYLVIILLPILISFIYFNKPKAKLYMGDTGSIILGYVIGFCLLEILSSKYWYLCISLYSYVILDCSLTKLKKILSGKSVFNRNFSYFFQIPIKKLQKNNFKVLGISIIYNLTNLLVVYLVLLLDNPNLVFLSLILSLIKINIFMKIK